MSHGLGKSRLSKNKIERGIKVSVTGKMPSKLKLKIYETIIRTLLMS